MIMNIDKSSIIENREIYRKKIRYGFACLFMSIVFLGLLVIVSSWYIDSKFIKNSIRTVYFGILIINFYYLLRLRTQDLVNTLNLKVLSNSFCIKKISSNVKTENMNEEYKGLKIYVIDVDEYLSKKNQKLNKNDVIVILQDFNDKRFENILLFQENKNGRMYIELYHHLWYRHSYILYTNYLLNRYKLIEEFFSMNSVHKMTNHI